MGEMGWLLAALVMVLLLALFARIAVTRYREHKKLERQIEERLRRIREDHVLPKVEVKSQAVRVAPPEVEATDGGR